MSETLIAPAVAMQIAGKVRELVMMHQDLLSEEGIQSESNKPSVYDARLMAEQFIDNLTEFAGMLNLGAFIKIDAVTAAAADGVIADGRTMHVTIEAPNSEGVEGKIVGGELLVAPAGYDLDQPFIVLCDHTGERIRVNNPWDCHITVTA